VIRARTHLSVLAAAVVLASSAAAAAEPETALGERVWVRPLSAHAWLIRSVSFLDGFGDVESNAVLLTGATASVLVDTPATDAQTAPVLAWAETALRRPVRHLVVTHWHADRMGGLGAARARGVATYALARTRALAREKGLAVPEHTLRPEERLTLSGVALATWFPGHGHTVDNLVVWSPGDALLVGGCFVKAAAAETLGNAHEIDPVRWATGIAALRRRYRQARTVVPGHGTPGGLELLAHTAALLEAHAGARAPPPPTR
jgi:metallo-beta-lactamase class B